MYARLGTSYAPELGYEVKSRKFKCHEDYEPADIEIRSHIRLMMKEITNLREEMDGLKRQIENDRYEREKQIEYKKEQRRISDFTQSSAEIVGILDAQHSVLPQANSTLLISELSPPSSPEIQSIEWGHKRIPSPIGDCYYDQSPPENTMLAPDPSPSPPIFAESLPLIRCKILRKSFSHDDIASLRQENSCPRPTMSRSVSQNLIRDTSESILQSPLSSSSKSESEDEEDVLLQQFENLYTEQVLSLTASHELRPSTLALDHNPRCTGYLHGSQGVFLEKEDPRD